MDLLSYLLRLGVSNLREAAKRGNLLAVAITGQARRSPHWRAVEKAWLSKHGHCAACGNNEQLQVHHVLPFHSHPELELADGTGRYCLARDPKNPRLFRENLEPRLRMPPRDRAWRRLPPRQPARARRRRGAAPLPGEAAAHLGALAR